MIELNRKGNYSQSDIQQFIEQRAEESNYLEFKSSKDWKGLTDNMMNKLSIIITAFANTYGGTLVFGMDTKRRRASSLGFINCKGITIEAITNGLKARIQRQIMGLIVELIHFDNDPERGVLIFTIPESKDSPHMAFDNKYYRRHNFREILMDEYEIRAQYNKSNISEVEFFGIINTNGIPTTSNGKFEHINFFPRILIRNTSSAIEHYYKIELAIPAELNDPSFAAMQSYFSRHEGAYAIFSIPNKTPLFQEELATAFEAKLQVTKDNYHLFDSENIRLKLFYSNGIKEHIAELKETFRFNHRAIKSEDFV